MESASEERCPACGTTCEHRRRVLVPVGRPFVECPGCRGFVDRPPYREWSGMPAPARLRLLLGGCFVATALAAALTLVFSLLRTERTVESILATGLVLLAVALSSWGLVLSSAIQRSNRRMSDPMYRARLAEFEMGRVSR